MGVTVGGGVLEGGGEVVQVGIGVGVAETKRVNPPHAININENADIAERNILVTTRRLRFDYVALSGSTTLTEDDSNPRGCADLRG